MANNAKGTLGVASSNYKIISILNYYPVTIKETRNRPATYIRQRSEQAILKDDVLINKVNLVAIIVKSIQADFTLGYIYRDVYYNILLFSFYIRPQLQLREIRYQGFRFSKNRPNLFLPAYCQRSLQWLLRVL